MEKLVYSASPHIKTRNTTKRIMIEVSIALLPACIAGIVFFGLGALWNLLIAVVFAVASEIVFKLCQRQNFKKIWQDFDFTSVVTGLLIGMNMYSTTKWYVPMLASIFAVVIVKMLFGGTGKNIVNPAIAGRIFVFMAFATQMTGGVVQVLPGIGSLVGGSVETGATNLASVLNPNISSSLSLADMFLGTGMAGAIGETCKLALIVGGVYLMVRGIINWRWPLVYIVVTGLFTVCLNKFDFSLFLPSILSGGLIMGALFMATDYVTSPITKTGNYIYFVLLGLLTAGLRQATGMEVVSFAILLGNLIVPLIDLYVRRKPFGHVKQKKQKEVE